METVHENKYEFVTNDDPNFERELDLITADTKPFIKDHLLHRITKQNCLTIIAYILAFQTEVNPAPEYRISTIYKLKHLAEYYNPKHFEDLTRQDFTLRIGSMAAVVVVAEN
jgi:hypothetical protein